MKKYLIVSLMASAGMMTACETTNTNRPMAYNNSSDAFSAPRDTENLQSPDGYMSDTYARGNYANSGRTTANGRWVDGRWVEGRWVDGHWEGAGVDSNGNIAVAPTAPRDVDNLQSPNGTYNTRQNNRDLTDRRDYVYNEPTPTVTYDTYGNRRYTNTGMIGQFSGPRDVDNLQTPDGYQGEDHWAYGTTKYPVTRSDYAMSDRAEKTYDGRYAGDERYAKMDAASAECKVLSMLAMKDKEEVEMGRLAQEKGSSAAVKRYGDALVRDHSAHGEKVAAVARSTNTTLWDANDTAMFAHHHAMNDKAMDHDHAAMSDAAKKERMEAKREKMAKKMAEHRDHMAELRGKSGAEFDQAFAKKMLEGHREMIAKVEKMRGEVKNAEVKQLLDETLPTLREHERMAKEIVDGSSK